MSEKEITNMPLKTLSMKTEAETIDRFNQLREQAGLHTANQMLVELLDRYEEPIRVNADIKELRKEMNLMQSELDAHKLKVADLTRELDAEKQEKERQIAENQDKERQIDALQQQLSEAQAQANQNAEAATATQLEMQQRIDNLTPQENQRVVSFTADNLKVLEYVAARESKRRNQAWSISHIINFFVYARFVKGMLNGDLGSVSDSELRKMGVSLKTKAKGAVEI